MDMDDYLNQVRAMFPKFKLDKGPSDLQKIMREKELAEEMRRFFENESNTYKRLYNDLQEAFNRVSEEARELRQKHNKSELGRMYQLAKVEDLEDDIEKLTEDIAELTLKLHEVTHQLEQSRNRVDENYKISEYWQGRQNTD